MDRRGRGLARASATGAACLAASYWGPGLAVTRPGRRLFGALVLCRVRTHRPVVALTFDDGPDPRYSERFVAALGGSAATFFVLGQGSRRWPWLVRGLIEAGHEVGCHGDTHRSLASLGPRATLDALARARDAVSEAAGTPPAFFRPAYGCFTLPSWVEANRLGMRRTLWSAWARDWEAEATPGSIAARILRGTEPGAILLLHDADGSDGAPERTLQALPAILEGLAARGLSSVTLSELVAARSVST